MKTGNLSVSQIKQFHEKIFSWWNENRREFPWRETTNPYHIMVSEIMLQQTQTSRVVTKYKDFIKQFPTFEKLAKASKADVLSLWSGLGYNRRAIWLQEAAKEVLELKEFPKTPEELVKLKGIGPYTARSILIFAFNLDLATVDTNIRRILIAEKFANEDTTEKQLFEIATKLVPSGKSRDWHNALMDYGSIIVTARKTGISPTSKQSIFKDSNREKRGQILKYLLEKKEASIDDLEAVLNLKREELEAILDKMVHEGLINKNMQIYRV
jgi:A/G-specific adenine glycosylase